MGMAAMVLAAVLIAVAGVAWIGGARDDAVLVVAFALILGLLGQIVRSLQRRH